MQRQHGSLALLFEYAADPTTIQFRYRSNSVPGRPSAIPGMRVALVQRGRDFHGLLTAMRGAYEGCTAPKCGEAMGARWPTRGIYSLRRIELLSRAARLLEK